MIKFLVLVMLLSVAPSGYKDAGVPANHHTYAKVSETSSNMCGIAPNEEYTNTPYNAPNDKKDAPLQSQPDYVFWGLIVNLALAVGTITIAVFSVRQANAAKDGAKLIIQKERARIRVDAPQEFDIEDTVGETPVVRFTIVLHGPTSAFITGSGVAAYWLPKDRIHVADAMDAVMFSIHDLPNTLSPNISMVNSYAFVIIDKDISNDIRSDIESGQLLIGIRGFIRHKDIFDNDWKTTFRYFWNLELEDGSTRKLANGEWMKSGPPEDNCETQSP